LSGAAVVEIEAVHLARSHDGVKYRKIFMAIWSGSQTTVGRQGLDVVTGKTVPRACAFVIVAFLTCHPWNP